MTTPTNPPAGDMTAPSEGRRTRLGEVIYGAMFEVQIDLRYGGAEKAEYIADAVRRALEEAEPGDHPDSEGDNVLRTAMRKTADIIASEAPLEVPASEMPANRVPGLPRPIEPEDVRVGMLVERRKGEVAYRDRVQRIDGGGFISSDPTLPYMWMPGLADNGWSLWLIEDAPAPDPDREAVEAIREASWSIPPSHAAAAKPDPLPGLPESRDLLTSLRARGWDLVKRDLARAEQ